MFIKSVTIMLCIATGVDAFVSQTIATTSSRLLRDVTHHEQSYFRVKRSSSPTRSIAVNGNRHYAGADARRLRRYPQMCQDGDAPKAQYTDVTVREAVEWTLGADSDFSYIDVRSPEEHARPTTPRNCVNIPAFEQVVRDGPPVEEDEDASQSVDYEAMEWKPLPGFVDRVKSQFSLDSNLLVGCKTERSSWASQILADAGFTGINNVESQSFMKTRHPVWMDY